MRLIYAAFILLMALLTSTQCQETAEDLYAKGEALFNQGKYDEAVQALDEAILLDPNDAKAWNGRAHTLYAQSKYDEAIQACDEAIRLDPSLTDAWNTKGAAFYFQGKYDEAIEAYDGAIRSDPNLAQAWSNKGDALRGQSKLDEAIQAYSEAIRLDPNNARTWSDKGAALVLQGKYDEAILSLDKAINLITQAQTKPPIPATTNGSINSTTENNTVKIIGIDSIAYPKVKASVFVDKSNAMAGNLKKEDFKIKEDDIETPIDDFFFTGNASGQKLDLAIVFDETGSMDNEINALKSKVKDLTRKINSSKIDARYSLVTFNGVDVATKINWTNDVDSFRNIIGMLSVSGGDSDLPENSLDAIETALSLGFRLDAQKIIIVVTDEPSQQKGDGKSSSAYTTKEVKNRLLNSGAMLIAVSPDFSNPNVDPNVPRSDLPKYGDMRVLANEVGNLWIDIKNAEFSTILQQFQEILVGTYVIEYTSPDQTPSEVRTVLVSVNSPGYVVDKASSSYNSPGRAYSYNDSDLVLAWFAKGTAFHEQGKNNEAIQSLDEAIMIAPQNDPNLAFAWAAKGSTLDALGKYDEAIQAYDEAIMLDPNNPAIANAWNLKGGTLDRQGKYDEAIQASNEALRLDPNLADAWNTKGYALYDLGKYDEAIQACDEAIMLNPTNAQYWSNKGRALIELGKYDDAIQALDEALRLDPNYFEALLNRGLALKSLGRLNE